ncbi:tubulin-specific chaperone C [Eurytemora carolleeae]|uniref:tubulin-specific chaperone C n=1 Tax=Eurytemora carolleeae TaxID=1294199 RepID=UPI000C772F95|nr:tubulin-specific chaperone C [Eurytemora carolleeae]|eukprot:XP_023345008.1 tubulin-specific chaperone C-like [Eurytemora affinis]
MSDTDFESKMKYKMSGIEKRREQREENINKKTIGDLNSEFQDLQSKVLPKKKFGFKGVKQRNKAPDVIKDTVDSGDKLEKPAQVDTGVSIRDKTSDYLSLEPEAVNSGDVTLSNLENCRVKLVGSPSTVHLSNIRNCKIVAGPVSSSIFIENCSGSTLVLSSQQLRIHNTTETDFHIHVTSKAVIEDCNQLRFCGNPFLSEISEEIWEISRLDKNINNWDQVGDFNWLAKDKASPHWSKLGESDLPATSQLFLQ